MEEPESDPDFDEEQYQNELNDAVDDGGGCMETLQAANQVSNSNETQYLTKHPRLAVSAA